MMPVTMRMIARPSCCCAGVAVRSERLAIGGSPGEGRRACSKWMCKHILLRREAPGGGAILRCLAHLGEQADERPKLRGRKMAQPLAVRLRDRTVQTAEQRQARLRDASR